MNKSIAASIVLVCLTVVLTALCLSSVNCQQAPGTAASRPEPVPQSPDGVDSQMAGQKPEEIAEAQDQSRTQAAVDPMESIPQPPIAAEAQVAEQRRREAAEAQRGLRGQTESDREQRINELMARATSYWKQQQYEASLAQLEALLVLDPFNSEARALRQMAQDMVYLRKQLEVGRLSGRQRTEMFMDVDEAHVPYADEITYPKNWRMIDPSSAPSASSQAGQGGMGGPSPSKPSSVPMLGSVPLTGSLFRRAADGGTAGRIPVDLFTVREDEIWVIARAEGERPQAQGPAYETPGSGAMLAQIKEEKVPLPLKHTDVKGKVCGYIATVEVVQQFANPFSEKIEAVYVFPLPQNAAVNEFIMVIGTRRIRGIIRERQEAEQIYTEARRQGYIASLLTQERPNIFTQKVANIEPGKAIDVHIKYFNTLAYADGWYEFSFPMVVGPRFNPPGCTEGVGAVGRGKRGLSGQTTEVQYLKSHERSGHDIALALEIDAGVKIEEIACTSHAIEKNCPGSEKVHVQLSPLDNIPNKDFVLRFRVAGETVKSALVTHRDERGGFFTLMLYPPQDLQHVQRAPMEMVFVLDCSGSMSGQPIAKSKEAIRRALRKLGPDDTFQVIRFSDNASQLGRAPVPATPENVRKALAYVDSLEGEGGTMMIEGIRAALSFPHDPRRFRLVSFLTDGYIGNEAEILGEIHRLLGDSRIFSFGIGSSVNRYLLDRMAKLGKGAVAYIGPNDSGTEVVDRFYDCIRHPALTDVRIDWGELEVSEVYPRQIPDLFVGRPIILTGRFQGQAPTTIRVAGKVGQSEKEIRIPVEFEGQAPTHPGLACVWARKRIEDLASQCTYDQNPDLPGEIKQVALQYGLMSAYTAFIAVDSSRTTAGDHGVTVAVPVPVPDGVRYETTVQD